MDRIAVREQSSFSFTDYYPPIFCCSICNTKLLIPFEPSSLHLSPKKHSLTQHRIQKKKMSLFSCHPTLSVSVLDSVTFLVSTLVSLGAKVLSGALCATQIYVGAEGWLSQFSAWMAAVLVAFLKKDLVRRASRMYGPHSRVIFFPHTGRLCLISPLACLLRRFVMQVLFVLLKHSVYVHLCGCVFECVRMLFICRG